MTDNPCGLFDGEVFADVDGTYVGDFSVGDGPGGPFGWVACMSYADPATWFGCFRSFSHLYRCAEGKPRVAIGVPFAFGAGSAYTVADSSGPAGLEAMPAMRVDLPGSPTCYVGWAGAQVVDALGEWQYGLLDGDTGWDPPSDQEWLFSCYAKVVPDANDVTVTGAKLRFDVSPNGFGTGSPTGDSLTLTDEWQFFSTTFFGGFIPSSSFYWPLIGFFGDIENRGDDTCRFFDDDIHITTYLPYGSVLIKCAHLYPPVVPGGNWIDSFHGHG